VAVTIALVSFGVVFLGELPDKTMFASLLLATRGRPVQVWLGTAAAFVVHVAIAVTAGAALFALLPHRYADVLVAVLFLAAAVYSWADASRAHEEGVPGWAPGRGALLGSFVVIFLAEWGDLTQILTADLAVRYHAPLPVAAGSLLALWAVAALAVASGHMLARLVSVGLIRRLTAVVLAGLAGYTAWLAFA
jgi:putative Ca2+/H+ antiporter (TMEM165/GDT1 family)